MNLPSSVHPLNLFFIVSNWWRNTSFWPIIIIYFWSKGTLLQRLLLLDFLKISVLFLLLLVVESINDLLNFGRGNCFFISIFALLFERIHANWGQHILLQLSLVKEIKMRDLFIGFTLLLTTKILGKLVVLFLLESMRVCVWFMRRKKSLKVCFR